MFQSLSWQRITSLRYLHYIEVALKRTCLNTPSRTYILPKYSLLCCTLDRCLHVISMSYHHTVQSLFQVSLSEDSVHLLQLGGSDNNVFVLLSPERHTLFDSESFRGLGDGRKDIQRRAGGVAGRLWESW